MGPIFKKYRLDADRTQEEVADKLLPLVETLNIPGDAILHPQLQAIDNEDEQLIRMLMRLNQRDKEVIRTAIQKMLDTADREHGY